MVCLLAGGRPRVSAEGIPRVVVLGLDDLVAALGRMFSLVARAAAPIFTFDGRTGHSVTLFAREQERDSFLFHDPWPGDSLLSRHANAAGVAAELAENGLWRISSEDLKKVIVAAFVFPSAWATLSGISTTVTYADLRSSEFWSFFNISESQVVRHDESRSTAHLKTGGFREHVDLRVDLSAEQHVTSAELELRHSWAIGPPWGANPFALDIAKSYVGAFAPAPDRGAMAHVAEALSGLRDQEQTRRNLENAEFVASIQGRVVLAYTGVEPEANAVFDYCRLEVEMTQRDEPWLQLRVVHF